MATDESGLIQLAETVADLPPAAKTERPEDRAHRCLVCGVRLWTPDVDLHAHWHTINGETEPVLIVLER